MVLTKIFLLMYSSMYNNLETISLIYQKWNAINFQFEQLNMMTQILLITNTYTTRTEVPFTLHKIEDDLRAIAMVDVWSDDDFSILIPTGLTSGWIKNLKVLSLRLYAEIWAWRWSSINLKWRYMAKLCRIQDKENTEATIICELSTSTIPLK